MQDRLHFLDSSRGLAAFVVFLSHFVLVFYPGLNQTWIASTPLHLLWDGSNAVIYFFIHSGFILTYRLHQRKFELTKSSYSAFVWRRIFRIYPLFLFVLLAMFALVRLDYFRNNPLGPLSFPLNYYWQGESGFADVIRQSLLVLRLPNDPVMRLIPQDWSLSIEMAVSLLLPAFYVFQSRFSYWLLGFIYITVQLLGLDRFVFDFVIGIVLVSLYPSFRNWWMSKSSFPAKGLILILGIALSGADHYLPFSFFQILEMIFIHTKAIGCALFLLVILASEKIKKMLSIRLLVLQGKTSYSIYLVHLLVLFLCFPLASVQFLSTPALFIMIYTLVFLLSIFLYHGIELPMIRLGRKLESKIFKIS